MEKIKRDNKVLSCALKTHNEVSNNKLQTLNQKNGTKSVQTFFEGEIPEEILSPKKKMQTRLHAHTKPFQAEFYPATLKTLQSGWYIEFYAFNPFSEKLERYRQKVNKAKKLYGSVANAKREITKLCNVINWKLESGWSPFVDVNIRSLDKLGDVCRQFYDKKASDLRENSNRSYRSNTNQFIEWLEITGKINILPCDFTQADANRYMDYKQSQKIGHTTWNNYKNFQVTLFEWMIERGYCSKNHFSTIKSKKEEKKKRVIIPLEKRQEISEYLKSNDKPFYIICLLVYSCLLRPQEILRLKISDIDLDRQIISMSGAQTKNMKNRNIVIPNSIIEELREYWQEFNIYSYDKDLILFSTQFKPGKKIQIRNRASEKWSKMRTVLDLPNEYQLYSLRDSSIVDMLMNNMNAKVIQIHADHHDLAMTSKYANHITPAMQDDIKKNSPSFN